MIDLTRVLISWGGEPTQLDSMSSRRPQDRTLEAQIDAAQVYENLFVPAEFQEWAPRMVAAAKIRSGQRVLDVACGTGVLSREAARCVGPTGFVAGLDLDPGVLAVAARRSSEIEWRQGRAELLPYADDSFDAVVSQFGLMFFPDRPRALREMLRVLASRGRIAVAVWDSLDHTPAYAAFVALLEQVAGPPAAAALRAPFALGDRDELATLFASAGLPEGTIETSTGTSQFHGIRPMIEAELRGWLPLAGVLLSEDQMNRVFAEAERPLSPYVASDGSVRFDSPAHIVTGTKP